MSSRTLPALTAAASLFVWANTALAQRAPSNPPVVFTPNGTEVVPWTVARHNLMRALQGSRLQRSTANPLRHEYRDHARRARVDPQHVSFWDGRETGVRRVVRFAEGDLVLIDMWLDKVWGAGVPLRASTASDRRSRMRSYEDTTEYFRFYFSSRSEAEALLQAWHDARASAARADQSADDPEAEFARRAALWRARDPRPPLSDAANRHRIVAEDAARAKDYDSAIEGFESALETDPTWPSGNFNLALLYEAVEDWEEAGRYMRRFLLLEPDGPEAPAAREKIILWEGRARRVSGSRN